MKGLIIAYCIMLGVIFILPAYTIDSYSIISNTASELGAQETPNAWVMNLTFALLGLMTILAGWVPLKKFVFQKVILLVFGISLSLTGVFRHAPIQEMVAYDLYQDQLHSFFATLTGFSFTVLAISMAFILKDKRAKLLALFIGFAAAVLSGLMFEAEAFKGIWQRIIFILCFGWIILVFAAGNNFERGEAIEKL